MNTKELISIIVPIFNKESYLNICIGSICNQTYSNLEIILVDDGSTDDSGKICDDWRKKDERIKVFHTVNSGAGHARNFGMEKSRGNLIMFIDADDVIDSRCIEEMRKCFLENNVEMVTCAFKIFRNDEVDSSKNETVSLLKHGLYQRNEFVKKLAHYDVHYYFNGPYAKLINKNIFNSKKIKFEDKDYLGEDFVFNMKLLRLINNIYVMDEPFYNYRIDSIKSLSKSKHSTQYFFERYSIMFQEFINLLEECQCIVECEPDINRFKNKIVKLVSRNVIFDEQYSTYNMKKQQLSQFRKYFVQNDFLKINLHNSLEIIIAVACIKFKLYFPLYILLTINNHLHNFKL